MPINIFQAYVVYNKYYYLSQKYAFNEFPKNYSIVKILDLSKLKINLPHIFLFLLKRAVNIAIQRNFYGTMPQ